MSSTPSPLIESLRGRIDRAGIVLSGLCAIHCIASVLVVSVLGLGGEVLLSPAIHRVGLILAVTIGAVALGFGVRRHGRRGPLIGGAIGLSLMALAIVVGHGAWEAGLTVTGVAILAAAHIRNLRETC